MKGKMKGIVDTLNVSKHLSNHLVGKNHSHTHRKAFGGFFLILGSIVLFLAEGLENPIAHVAALGAGGAGHGLGLIPFFHGMEGGNNAS